MNKIYTVEFNIIGRMTCLPLIQFPHCLRVAATVMLSYGLPPLIVAGMLGHSISILLTTYAHFIPTMRDQAVQLSPLAETAPLVSQPSTLLN